ncbi:MAG: VTT domain-containing protein [Candidatus Yanofskybacteria bacterium]|nr:VTT domain-containing protein [Candidatus Yanofskybacteria bacterium]
MQSFFLNYFGIHPLLGYGVFLLWLALEGQTAMFTAAFLTHQGVFQIGWVFLFSLIGVIGTDYLLYYLGHHLHGRPWFVRLSDYELVRSLDNHLTAHPNRTFFLAKFSFVHTPIMIRAGSIRMPIRLFFKGDILSSVLWIVVVFSLGYGSSATATLLRSYFHYVEVGLGVTLVLFLLIMHFVSRWFRKEM